MEIIDEIVWTSGKNERKKSPDVFLENQAQAQESRCEHIAFHL